MRFFEGVCAPGTPDKHTLATTTLFKGQLQMAKHSGKKMRRAIVHAWNCSFGGEPAKS